MTDVVATLRRLRVLPVIVIDDPANAVPLAQALMQGGIACAEITFRTAAASDALRRISAELPDMLVGAGTVLTTEQAAWAKAAGAQFVVSPGLNPRVVDYCLTHKLPVYPGVCTPTEIEAALAKGLRVLKFFPAEAIGGLRYLRAMSAPYGDVEFIPTGGINAANLEAYLGFEKVIACGGTWMASAEWIAQGQFDRIREESQKANVIAHGLTAPA